MPECFVIMPLTTPKSVLDRYSGDANHFLHVLDHLFVPAIEAAGFTAKKPIAEGSDLIHAEIVRNLENADMVLCDISILNANVFFELGIRTALNRPVCVIRDDDTTLPFDVGSLNFHTYKPDLRPWVLPDEIERLTVHLRTTAERSEGTNALWRHFGLTQRGTDAIASAPGDGEAVALRLLLQEVQSLRSEVGADWSTSSVDNLNDQLLTDLSRLGLDWTRATSGDDKLTVYLNSAASSDQVGRAKKRAKSFGLEIEFVHPI